jgi:hypothetical protein
VTTLVMMFKEWCAKVVVLGLAAGGGMTFWRLAGDGWFMWAQAILLCLLAWIGHDMLFDFKHKEARE